MPEAEYVWLPRHDLLQFEEMSALVDVFTDAGVDKIRLTGGEPLLRRDLPDLVRMLSRKSAIRDLALTTNGVALAAQAQALSEAGLHRITVSLDTLQPDRFQALTRFDALPQVLAGIDEASRHFSNLKLDAVVIRGTNDDEVVPLVEYGKRIGAEVRFIEYMDVDARTGRLPPGNAGAAGPSVRTDRCRPRELQRAGGSVPASGWDGIRDYLFDDRSVLPHLRSKQADSRRHVVSVPLRHYGHRFANAAASWNVSGRHSGNDQVGLGRARRPWRGRTARGAEPRAAGAGQQPEEGPAPGDAHARRLACTAAPGGAARSGGQRVVDARYYALTVVGAQNLSNAAARLSAIISAVWFSIFRRSSIHSSLPSRISAIDGEEGG
jgi:hypothetical protein